MLARIVERVAQAIANKPPGAPRAPDEWRQERGVAAIAAIEEAWDRLAEETSTPAIAGGSWMRAYWLAYGGRDEDLVVHSFHRDGRLVAVLPLRAVGRVVRRWVNPLHYVYPYITYSLAEPMVESAGIVLDGILTESECLVLNRIHERGAVSEALIEAARQRGLAWEKLPREEDAVFDLEGSPDRARDLLPKNLRHNTPKQLRRLEKQGKLEFDVLLDQGAILGVFDECVELEARGWKGQTGRPLQREPEELRFYQEMIRAESAAGRMAIYTLRLDGRLIAFELCLRARGRIDGLKLAYDETLAKLSPSNVLRLFVYERELREGEIRTYHFGQPQRNEWKRRWASRIEPLCTLRIYGPHARGRTAHLVFDAVHRASAAVQKNPTMARIAARLEDLRK